jgi:arginyl-tRNA--protein-N-Asp/Glu arginylyltransferase
MRQAMATGSGQLVTGNATFRQARFFQDPLAEPAGLANDAVTSSSRITMTDQPRDTPQFFLTSPSPCPYLPGRQERKVFTHLVGKRAYQLNEILTQGGFRRSQSIAYRPACESCRACVSVRVLVNEFEVSRSFRRIMARNADLTARMIPAQPTAEQYGLFRSYLDTRHADGGMVDMSVLDYAAMVEDSHVETRLVEYRRPATGRAGSEELVGVVLTDVLSDGLSMVYSFYDPEAIDRSLGTFLILDHIAKTRAFGLPYLYLGYWVEGSRKMDYKARFTPQERLGMMAWERVER